MAYFRLISMWGDVPYFDKIIESNDEVANISRTSITEIKQHIYDDFTYAWEKLPAKPVVLLLQKLNSTFMMTLLMLGKNCRRNQWH